MRDLKSQFDAQIDDILIEIKSDVRAIRSVRSSLIELAYAIKENYPHKKGLLLLPNPAITVKRLEREWSYAWQSLRPEVTNRLGLVIFKNGQWNGFPAMPDPKIRPELEHLARKHLGLTRPVIRRTDAYPEIVKILIHEWLQKRGPVTTEWLTRVSGSSYPTVANVLHRLGSTVKRHSDRRVELKYFPIEQWSKIVSTSESARSTVRYSDSSGHPRSVESLMRRLNGPGLPELGVGGVFGAKYYYPDLDLVGNPRLDLTIHSWHKKLNLAFVEQLDPALQLVDDPNEPASVVLHFLNRQDSFFRKGPGQLNLADPVECLLDLHEVHLEQQASDFLNALTT